MRARIFLVAVLLWMPAEASAHLRLATVKPTLTWSVPSLLDVRLRGGHAYRAVRVRPKLVTANILVDARLLMGKLSFAQRDGTPVGPTCASTETVRDPVTGDVSAISTEDLKTTEVYFFREGDDSEPIAHYAVATPDVQDDCTGGSTEPQAHYTRVRLGPANPSNQASRLQCNTLRAKAEASLTVNDRFYLQTNCGPDSESFLRLEPGDRIEVFALNHATGYAGLSTVTVPAINASQLAPDGTCPADTENGGPLTVNEDGRSVPLSRCVAADLGIEGDVTLYPPEVDVRMARAREVEGLGQSGLAHENLVRTGGAATTSDDYLRIDTHWRVQRAPIANYAGTGPTGGACPSGHYEDGGNCEGALADREVDGGEVGIPLEVYCSELPASSPLRDGGCLSDDSVLAEVPAGVPAMRARLMQLVPSAHEASTVTVFDVVPGRRTGDLLPALKR